MGLGLTSRRGESICAAAILTPSLSGRVQKVCSYVAPKLFGGRDAKTPVEGAGIDTPDEAAQLRITEITRLGEDILIESEVTGHVHRDC